MIDNLRHTSPAPETGCRRSTVLSDPSSSIELDGDRIRHQRLELRRPNSLDPLRSGLHDRERCFKRRRPENGKLLDNIIKESDEGEEEECGARKLAVAKQLEEVGERENPKELIIMRCWSYGSVSVIGRRREMEDAVSVELGFLERGSKTYDFFGVYDGHGGSLVAHACRDRLHRVLVEILEKEDGDYDNSGSILINWNKVMLESFEKIDEEVNRNGAAVATMGSTALVAVVGEEELVVANCGDSRAVLSRGGAAVPLSDDHKPDRWDELERIELCGGRVIDWNGQRVLGVLATSRSIGDHYLKPYVISDPEVIVTKRTNGDEFLILASDGLWDVISNEAACNVVRRCLMNRSSEISSSSSGEVGILFEQVSPSARAAKILAELAISKGSKDNISVIVAELRRSSSR